jgi:cyclopropane fatty-acyl-phospholipid synthase-like methyltransferase
MALDPPKPGETIADIGCALGVFPKYLKERFPQCKVCGYELLESSLMASRQFFPNLDLHRRDITETANCNEQYDVVPMTGILSIFDYIRASFRNITKCTRRGGHMFIHSLFNQHPVDILIKCKKRLTSDNVYESRWAIFSQATVEEMMFDIGAKDVKFHRFMILKKLNRRDDFIRSWTEEVMDETSGDKTFQLVNGLCIKQPHFMMQARV